MTQYVFCYFPGGYFDSEGAPHYMHTDYQGSVVMVTDSAGRIEQHISYYPYGEPHRTPEGQPMLYCGKERLSPPADYDYGARRHYAPAINWPVPDPKAANYFYFSPYSFCAGNPIANKEINGEEWKVMVDCKGNLAGFEWVDHENAYDNNGNLLPGHYLTAIIFSAEGSSKDYDSNSNKNIGSSLCTVYLQDGTKVEYDACTYPSDTEKFSTVPEGQYEAKVGKHKNEYDALRMGDCGTKNFSYNRINLDRPNKAHPEKNYMEGVNIHKAGIDNLSGLTQKKKAVSEGCILIDRSKWDDFMSNFSNIDSVIGIILKR